MKSYFQKAFVILVSLEFSLQLAEAQSSSSDWTQVAEADKTLMGDWMGHWKNAPEKSYQDINPPLAAQVVNIDRGHYAIHFVQDLDRRADPYWEGEGRVSGESIKVDQDGWKFVVASDKISGVGLVKGEEAGFELKRVVRESPTMGNRLPKEAIVLFDGSNFDQWIHDDGRSVTWNLLDDGSMEINPTAANKDADPPVGGKIQTKKGFKDVRFHMEFRYPIEPGKSGQARGNSGLFFQGAYEVQILNSYGLHGYWNECGSLYKMAPPMVNAARPPMQWQTYDVTYKAAKFEEGKVVKNPHITVRLNGILIHKNQEIFHHTAHKLESRDDPIPEGPGPIILQDHTNRIQFRNIWIKEL